MSNLNWLELKKKWDDLSEKKCLSGQDAIEAVAEDGYALRYVAEQTEEICKIAVENDGFALQFVIGQTDEICKIAVEQDGYALQFVIGQTDEICKIAVEQNGYALQFVEEKIINKLAKSTPIKMTVKEIEEKFNVEVVKG